MEVHIGIKYKSFYEYIDVIVIVSYDIEDKIVDLFC